MKKRRTFIAYVGGDEHNCIHSAVQTQEHTGRIYGAKRHSQLGPKEILGTPEEALIFAE